VCYGVIVFLWLPRFLLLSASAPETAKATRWVAFAWSCYLASFLACAPPSEGCRRPVSEKARRRHGPDPGSQEGLEAGEAGTTDDPDRRIDADVGHLGRDRSEILVKMQALFSKKASEYSR
jgi:hypothetical protein